jgi:hypothetical protein
MESQQHDQAIMRNTLASEGFVMEFCTHVHGWISSFS